MSQKFDLIVVGGGPGGYVAAIRAAQLKMNVALVEAKHLGGVCLNWGCIPTKALLKASEMNLMFKHAEDFGFTVKDVKFDLSKIVSRSRSVAQQLSQGIRHLLKKNKVTVFEGYGRLKGKGTLEVTFPDQKKEMLSAPHIILATGAKPRQLPGLEADGKVVWTSKEAMVPEKLPKSLLVIGSGAIGIEFASFYRNLGTDVTVVEIQDRILPVEDPEISEFAQKAFEKQGMKIHTKASVESLKRGVDTVTACLKLAGGTQNLTVDRVIVAVGIQPNTEDLGIGNTKITLNKGHVIVNEWCETQEPGVYAIGDITGAPWLAHKASHEGILCVEKIAKQPNVHPVVKENIPGCTYSYPQIASIGLTEPQAKDRGIEVKVGRFPYVGNGKAIAMGESEGLVKTIFDATSGELLGAHMIGAEATELIQGYSIAKTLETTEIDLMHTVFPHPTLSEMMHESVLDAYKRAIHF